MGVTSISDVYLVDANGTGEIDPLEVFSLNAVPEPGVTAGIAGGVVLLGLGLRRRRDGGKNCPDLDVGGDRRSRRGHCLAPQCIDSLPLAPCRSYSVT